MDNLARQTEEADIHEVLEGPLANYAAQLLRFRPKEGGSLKPFVFNRTQHYIDQRLNAQLEEKKRVRAIILKGRKLGASTYVSGRFFRRAQAFPGIQVYILSHEKDSSKYLFDIAKTFYTCLPAEYQPMADRFGAQNMRFPILGCEYRVGTAGQKEVGRSQTPQLFHGSEVAFWPNAESHMSGAVQAVGDVPGTEIILESTANGIGGSFYNTWKAAERKEGDYFPIFIPWFWGEDYRRIPPHSWEPADEEADYARLYTLERDQAYWFYLKNLELGGTPGRITWRSRQEYPANPQEAFQGKGVGNFISPDIVQRARKRRFSDEQVARAPRLLGVDIARSNEEGEAKTRDRNRLIDRQGRRVGHLVNDVIASNDLMHVANRVARLIKEHGFDMTFIDVTGIGAGVYDILRDWGHGPRIMAVNFGSEPIKADRYTNKRAEMWGEMKAWLEDAGGAEIPDEEDIASHITAPTADFDANSRLKMEPKKSIKKRLGFSPDSGDAIALTFAAPVAAVSDHREQWRQGLRRPKRQGTSWMAS